MNRLGITIATGVIAIMFSVGLSGSAVATEWPQTDAPHSKDSPIVSRFAGSTIISYQEVNYDETVLPMGPEVGGGQFGKTLPTTGKVTRIAYVTPAGKTPAEVLANFRDALQASGFKLLYNCTAGTGPGSCGGENFAELYAQPMMTGDNPNGNMMIALFYATHDDVRYLLAELQRDGRKVDVGVLVTREGDNPTGVMLQIVENGQMARGQVTVDAAAMSKGLASDGKIALYGLQFANDSAELRPDSDDTLKQMSELLHQKPTLKVFIVGHTDNNGSLEHNLTLSQQRADAVVKALTSRFGIAGSRLAAKGVASYSPVANNHTDADRAKNRRVEMVEQ